MQISYVKMKKRIQNMQISYVKMKKLIPSFCYFSAPTEALAALNAVIIAEKMLM